MDTSTSNEYDVVVLGGGPAGLQAALTLGRMHHRVLLLDSGAYRNEAAGNMHNFLGHDGQPPAEFRAAARASLASYATVDQLMARADAIEAAQSGFMIALADRQVRAGRIVLATGLRDTLPDIPGVADLWGDLVAHCPYCHGHEFSDKVVAIIGAGPHVPRVALLLARIVERIVVLTAGGRFDEQTAGAVERLGIEVRTAAIDRVQRAGGGASVGFDDGPALDVGGLFIAPTMSQAAPFAAQLSLEMLPSGCVRIDEFGRTSHPGVYAAGDLAHQPAFPMPLASVLTAAAAGLLAATAVDQDLVTATLET